VKRWTSKFDIFSFDLLLFPIHWIDHWSLVAIDLKNDAYAYFDSMEFPNDKSAVKTGKMHIKKIL
jgi:Ulp1 family protease